jgi:hypothetical protein
MRVVRHEYFEGLSTIALAMENPLHAPDTPVATALHTVNFVVTVIFAIECGLKIVA